MCTSSPRPFNGVNGTAQTPGQMAAYVVHRVQRTTLAEVRTCFTSSNWQSSRFVIGRFGVRIPGEARRTGSPEIAAGEDGDEGWHTPRRLYATSPYSSVGRASG